MEGYAKLLQTGVFCEDCGEFISAEPAGSPQKCSDCYEDELIRAVENDEWPDGMAHSTWMDIRMKYSEPDVRV